MSIEMLRQAHARLMECNGMIRELFGRPGEDALDCYAGASMPPDMREQLRKHGDGYTLRSVPRSLQDLTEPDQEVVLIVGKFPGLAADSRLDPCLPVIDIPYWGRKLRPQICMPDGSSRRALFLMWQDLCPVHGRNLDSARANRSRLTELLPGLDELICRQAEDSRKLLIALAGWLREDQPGRQLILVTNRKDPIGRSRIPEIAVSTNLHVEVRLWGLRSQGGHLMDDIEEGLRHLSVW